MKVGDLVTLRWGEGKRGAGIIVRTHYDAIQVNHLREVHVQWFSEWEHAAWVRPQDLEIINENR